MKTTDYTPNTSYRWDHPIHKKRKRFEGRILKPASWQLEDLDKLAVIDNSANWSQMGCYKTSTALWNIEQKLDIEDNPRVLIITTASGKGAYMRDVPKCIDPRWQIMNVKSDGVYLIINGTQIKVGKHLAEKINYPHIVLTHYHTFSRTNIGEMEKCRICKGDGYTETMSMCPGCMGMKFVAKKLTVGDRLIQREWDLVACDEAHKIKNGDAKWSKGIKKITTRYKHAMTGSGFVNRPDEIWSILNWLEPDIYNDYWGFRSTYVEDDIYKGYATITGLRRSMVSRFRELRESFGPRRTKPEVFPDLTAPIYEDLETELNTTQRDMYNEIKRDLMTLDQKGIPIHSPNVLSQLSRMRQIAVATPEVISDEYDPQLERRVTKIRLVEPSSKLDALMEVLDGLQWDDEDKQQVVVFSCFVDPLNLLQKRLTKKGINWIRLLPTDSDTQRYQKWAVEFPKKKHQVFLSTIKLGGESIDLTSASYVVLLDLDWAPMNNDQAIERVWRPGFDTSKGAPIVIRLFAEDTIDQRMLDVNNTKLGWFQQIFGPEQMPTNVTVGDDKDHEVKTWSSLL